MSVIIRLQNLPWSANSYDIRQYFQGLSIPEGGVHIVGGELGDAFIAFSTDEDARQAMMLTGGKLKEVQVSLMLSSRSEMQKVIEAARSMTFPPLQPTLPAVPTMQAGALPQQPQAPPSVPAQPIPVPPKPEQLKEIMEEELKESRKRTRSRSRSRDRSRSGRKDTSRRRRSRSRDRDRRRKRSRSRSRGRDRYGRDAEKRDEFSKDKSKDQESKADGGRKEKSGKAQADVTQTPPPGLLGANNVADPFGLRGPPTTAAITAQLPYLDDRLTAAMRSTLSALNLPMPKMDDKNSIPGLGGDTRKDPTPPRGRNGRDVSPGHGGYPDPGPAFGPVPTTRGELGSAFIGGGPFGGALNRADTGVTIATLLQKQNLAFAANQSNQLPFGNNIRADPTQVWLNPQSTSNQMRSDITLNPPLLSLALNAFSSNRNEGEDRARAAPRLNEFENNSKDDDFRTRFLTKGLVGNDGGSFGVPSAMSNDRGGRMDRFPGPQIPMRNEGPSDRELSRFERDPRPFDGPPSGNRDFGTFDGRPMFQGGPGNSDRPGRFNIDTDGRPDFRDRSRDDDSSHRKWRDDDGPERGPRRDSRGLCVELKGCPLVLYKDIRRGFSAIGCAVEEILFMQSPHGRRVGVKFTNFPGKIKATRAGTRLKIDGKTPVVIHLPEDEFESFRDDPTNHKNQYPENTRRLGGGGFDDNRHRSRFRRDEGLQEDDNGGDREKPRDRDFEKRDSRYPEQPEPDNGDERMDDNSRDQDRWGSTGNGPQMDGSEAPSDGDYNQVSSDCILISNLPPGTTDRDICDFFSDVGLTPKKLHLMLNNEGEPSGEAYVEFWMPEQAKVACGKHGAPMGRVNVSVKSVPRRAVLEAVGPEDEDDSQFSMNSNNMGGPGPMGFPHPRLMNPRMAGLGPMPLFPNRGLGPRGPGPRGPGPGLLFPPSERNFNGPRPFAPPPMDGESPPAPSPDRVVTMSNLPYRAGTDEILSFFGPTFTIAPEDVFRKLNERGQPTSEARVVMPTAEDAARAVNTLSSKQIWNRNIKLRLLKHVLASEQ